MLGAARVELGLGCCDRALSLTMQVIRRAPTCAPAYAARGEAHLQAGDFEQALKLLKEAVQLDPDDAAVGRAPGSLRARPSRG